MFDSAVHLDHAPPPEADLHFEGRVPDFARAFDRDLGSPERTVPTRFERGLRTVAPNPLLDAWVERGSDGVYPLLEVGAGFGASTLSALERGADVIAFDWDETLLRYLRCVWAAERRPYEGKLTTVHGQLPELPLPDGMRASAILCSEGMEHASGPDVEASLRRFREVLTPAGVLCLTASETDHIGPFGPQQIARLVEQSGFRVLSEDARRKLGYPEVDHSAKGGSGLQLVAARA